MIRNRSVPVDTLLPTSRIKTLAMRCAGSPTYSVSSSITAVIVEDRHEMVYGELQYGAEDLDGHRWIFSQHVRELSPVEWGATIRK